MAEKTRIDENLQEYYLAMQEKETLEESDIVRLLDACRIKFKADMVYVAEALISPRGFVFSHVSFSEETYNLKGEIHTIPEEVWDKVPFMYDREGLCEERSDIFFDRSDYGILHYGILQNRVCDGIIGMMDINGERRWTREEKAAMQKIGRVLKYIICTERYGKVNDEGREKMENQGQVIEAIFSSTDCGMIRHTVKGNRILGVNNAALKILGYESKKELEEAGFDLIADSVADDDKPRLRKCLKQLKKVGDSADIEYKVYHKDGTMINVSGKIKLLMENGELIYQRILLDRTDWKINEEIEQWEQKRQQIEMIQALCEEYSAVYFVDLDTGMSIPYRTNARGEKYHLFQNGMIVYQDSMLQYIQEAVCDVDKEYLYMMSMVEHIRMELEEQPSIHVNYRVARDEEIEYYQIKIVRVGIWKDGKHTIVMGFHSIDDEIRSEISQKELIEKSYEIIAGLSRDYNFIGLINCETGTMSAYKASDESPEVSALAGSTDYAGAIAEYSRYVCEEEKEMWRDSVRLDCILERLQDESYYNVNIRNNAPQAEYIQFRFTKIPEVNREYQVVLATRVITETIKKEIEQRTMLEEALEQARYANQAKSTFLSNMSHDIRTPINGIMGMGHIAMNSFDDPDRVKDCLYKIMESSEHLLGLINDVLDMSRIESGKTSLNHEFMDMNLMIEHCTAIIQGQLVDREIEFVQEISQFQYPFRIGDELRLRQILVNILGNAVKFTPDGGKIFFRVEENPSGDQKQNIRFEIEDTGIGMTSEYQEHIWEPFSQERQGSRTSYKGTGLGMSITKQFIDLMGGAITVKSKLNEGSRFVIDVPVEITAFEPEEKEEPALKDLEGMSVLVVEDNDLNMEIICCMLEEKKIKVACAENGKVAVEMFVKAQPGEYDAILMDIMMPVMDGLEATRVIRRLKRTDAEKIPIIAMTANAYDEDVKKTKNAGMNAHLTKPLDIQTVITTLSNFYCK